MPTTRWVESLKRLTNSKNGNPRFRVYFTDGSSALTAPDAGWVYELSASIINSEVEVTFSRNGTLTSIKAVK